MAHLGRRSSARCLFVVVLFVTHLTSIYDRALDDRWLHEVEHAAYLLGAVLDVVRRCSAPAGPARRPASAPCSASSPAARCSA